MSSDSTVVTPPVTHAVVPVAGLGTRLRPLTHAFPKELLPIGREPVLAHVAAEMRAAGITDALFVVSERKPQIRAYFGDLYVGEDDSLPPLRCHYTLQREQRGSGHALLCAAEWVGDQPFLAAFGDCLIESATPAAPLRRLIETFRSERATAAILVEQVALERVSRYGIVAPRGPQRVDVSAPFEIAGIVEKPRPEEAPSLLAAAARWILGPAIFAALRRTGPDPRGEMNIPDAIQLLLQEGCTGWAAPLQEGEARRDIGSMESFFAQFVRAALRDRDYGAQARKAAREELRRSSE